MRTLGSPKEAPNHIIQVSQMVLLLQMKVETIMFRKTLIFNGSAPVPSSTSVAPGPQKVGGGGQQGGAPDPTQVNKNVQVRTQGPRGTNTSGSSLFLKFGVRTAPNFRTHLKYPIIVLPDIRSYLDRWSPLEDSDLSGWSRQ